jgi:hypothetical protein
MGSIPYRMCDVKKSWSGLGARRQSPTWQLKEATAYQRHRIRQQLATGAWRDFDESKIERLSYVDPSTEYARTLRHL